MRYNGTPVLDVPALGFCTRTLVSVVGPNGAGKSTLLGIMAGLRDGYGGECRLEGREVRQWPRRDFARAVSFVPQSLRLEFPFTAEQVVLMGRTPYCDGLYEAPQDHAEVERAMEVTDTLEFRTRDFRSLSGGERQRVVLASALAQQPRVLLLDEPVTFLDIKHQVGIHRILRTLCDDGLLVVAATHDLNHALTYSDRVIVLNHGRVVADGEPADALGEETLREVFEVDAEMRNAPEGGRWIRFKE